MLINLATKSEKKDGRVINFTGSTESVNDHGHIVKQDGWNLDRYKKNPVFLWSHNYWSELPIGKSNKTVVNDKKLSFDIEFATEELNPFAEQVYQLYQNKFLNAVSVGFNAKKINWLNEDDQASTGAYMIIEEADLYELSGVLMGSDPNAIKNGIKNGLVTHDQLSILMCQKFSNADVSKKTNSSLDLDVLATLICCKIEERRIIAEAKINAKNKYSYIFDELTEINNSVKKG